MSKRRPSATRGQATARIATPLLAGALLVALFLAPSATAAVGSWSTGGPANADVTAVAVDPATPATVYAASDDGGVYKSTDSGASWSAINTGLTETNVNALVIDPGTPQTVYAATIAPGGVFKSIDGGASWSATNSGLTTTDIGSLAIDPSDPQTLYAGGSFRDGVFKSTDGGASWTEQSTGLTNERIRTLAVDPSTPSTIYVGTFGGLFRSTDGGASWSLRSNGLTDDDVAGVAFDPVTSGTLYAATVIAGVFKSTDGGASWSASSNGFTDTYMSAVVADPLAPGTLYAAATGNFRTSGGGVYRTTDGGDNWSRLGRQFSGSSSVTSLAINPSGASVYAGTAQDGVFQYSFEGSGDDGDPPETTLGGYPPSGQNTTDNTPTFTFGSNEPGSTFTCELDGSGPFSCSSPYDAPTLADGPHTFSVFATDLAGNADPTPATRSFGVDTNPSPAGLLTQPAGAAGCTTAEAKYGCAVDAGTAREAHSVAVSPDGLNVYSVGSTVDYEGTNPTTSKLTVFDRGSDGSLSSSGTQTIAGANAVAVSPDGANVYVTTGSGVAVFNRAANGLLTSSGGPSLADAYKIAISPDGTSVYVTAGDEVATFDRAANGSLTRDGGAALAQARDVVVSPDGASLYALFAYGNGGVADGGLAGVAVFDRAAGGGLTRKPGAAGCISETGEAGCADGFGLLGFAYSLAISPDGSSLYSIASSQFESKVHRGSLAVFDRAADGSLTQKSPGEGCLAGQSQGVPPPAGCSEGGRGLQAATSIAVSPDGINLYVTGWRGNHGAGGGGIQDGSIATFDRAADGSITPKPVETCCLTDSALSGGNDSAGDGRGLIGAVGVTVSPDGLGVYTAAIGTRQAYAHEYPGAVAVFDRDAGAPVDDTDPPETTITVGPADGATITDDSPQFAFVSDEAGSSFKCAIDGGGFSGCGSPKQLGPLAKGPHSFSVVATDLAGNPDPSPATRSFTVVSDTADLVVNDEGDSGSAAAQAACEDGDPGCTLRAAIASPHGDDQPNSITFAAGAATITLSNGKLTIADDVAGGQDVAILGPGARALELSGAGSGADDALLEVPAGVEAEISGLTFSGFDSGDSVDTPGDGTVATAGRTAAAVLNRGDLDLLRVSVRDSSVSATATAGQEASATASGGGVYSSGTLTLTASTVRDNQVSASATAGAGDGSPGAATATATGGGLLNDGGTLEVVNSTVSGNANAASATGGSSNPTTSEGGGIANRAGGSLELSSSTVAFNTAAGGANLFTAAGGASQARSTLLAEPGGGGANCAGAATFTSAGFNLEDADSCGLDAGSDQVGAAPALGPLADNGGPTDTHAIGLEGDALDAGDRGATAATDQRGPGFARTVNFPATPNGGDGTDVGAYELRPRTEGPVGAGTCADGYDNDADGDVDAADADCQSGGGGGPGPAPAPGPGSGSASGASPEPDDSVVRLQFTAPKAQKQKGKKIKVKVSVGAGEPIEAAGSGKVKIKKPKATFKLKAKDVQVGAGGKATLTFKPGSKKDAKKIAKAIKKWKSASRNAKKKLAVKAKVTITVTDDAGNTVSEKRVLTLK